MESSKLFTPLKVGNLQLSHRIALPPMTRFRVADNHVPQDITITYYEQRASIPGTLLVTEGTLISPRPGVFKDVPGLWSPEQIAQWRRVTDAVHAKGSYIYAQLWALGRVADIDAWRQESGYENAVLSSSSAAPFYEGSEVRELTEDEIQGIIGDFAKAAKNAIELAGFDGVEIHGANGYLVDQFIQGSVNQRTDKWGGSVENRARFPLEIVRAVVDAVGAERTAIRYSPWNTFQGMGTLPEDEQREQFGYLAKETAKFGLSYVHIIEARVAGPNLADGAAKTKDLDFFFDGYGKAGPVIIAGGYSGETAREAVEERYKDYEVVVAIGKPWTANPDLPFKLKKGLPLRKYEREHFYAVRNPKGYIDYEFSEEFKAAAAAA